MSDKKQLPDKCAVTRDLMPLCIDGTASEASQRRVDKHVAGCDPCAVVYREMQTQIDLDVPVEQETQQFETAVKKVKHKHAWRKLRNVLLGIVMALVVCAGLAYGYYWYFVEEVPVPVESYKMELTLHASAGDNTPVIIKTEDMAQSAKVHIEVRQDGTVMDDDQQMRPNLTMYIWASTNRTADVDLRGPKYNYYAFDQVAATEKGVWNINGETYKVDTIYQGAPDAEQTLLYKTGFKDNLKWTATDSVLHAVDSVEVMDYGKPFVTFVTPMPTFAPSSEGVVDLTPEPWGQVLSTTTPMPTATAVPSDLLLYYNTLDQAIFYHVDPMCSSLDFAYTPLEGKVQYGELNDDFYISLQACPHCGAPQRNWSN